MKKNVILPLIAVFALALGQFVWAQSQSAGATRRALRGFNDPVSGGATLNANINPRGINQNLKVNRSLKVNQNFKVMFAKRRQTTIKYGTRKPRGGYTNATVGGNSVFPPLPPGATGAIFIIDISGSMDQGFRSTTAMDYTIAMFEDFIKGLPPSKNFALYCFGELNHPWPAMGTPHKWMKATKANKDNATAWIKTYPTAFGTSRYMNSPLASFQDALKLKPPVIYFLGDGDMDSQEAAVTAACAAARPKPIVHSTCIGPYASIPLFQALATATGGTFTNLPSDRR